MSRARFERIIMAVPQEYLDEIRISAEADAFMETIFGKEITEECDKVLIPTGRLPLTSSLGLENAGVKTDDKGFIPVDDGMRTNIDNIYATGDIIPTSILAPS